MPHYCASPGCSPPPPVLFQQLVFALNFVVLLILCLPENVRTRTIVCLKREQLAYLLWLILFALVLVLCKFLFEQGNAKGEQRVRPFELLLMLENYGNGRQALQDVTGDIKCRVGWNLHNAPVGD